MLKPQSTELNLKKKDDVRPACMKQECLCRPRRSQRAAWHLAVVCLEERTAWSLWMSDARCSPRGRTETLSNRSSPFLLEATWKTTTRVRKPKASRSSRWRAQPSPSWPLKSVWHATYFMRTNLQNRMFVQDLWIFHELSHCALMIMDSIGQLLEQK